jgi:hypothetical protein
MVGGPRQAGKTTLLRGWINQTAGSLRTLDNADTLRAAIDDPAAFVAYGPTPRGIDEVQRGGDDLVRAIKIAVDEDPQPGQFILSGSSRFLTVPTLSESLAGRVAFVDLWPLSMPEQTYTETDPVRTLFGDPTKLLTSSSWKREDYVKCVGRGGYPEVLRMSSDIARQSWFDGYLATIIGRDIQSFANLGQASAIPRLLGLIAARAGSLAVLSDLAQGAELARETARNYLSYLDTVYLTTQIPAWSSNFNARLVKSPKLYLTDSGLAAHLLGATTDDLANPEHRAFGPLVETFVATELMKALSATLLRAQLFHLRAGATEVDFVLQGPDDKIVAIEVKASTSPGGNAFKGLRWLRERLGDQLHAGYLLHLGIEAASRGDRIFSLPLSALWNHRHVPRS